MQTSRIAKEYLILICSFATNCCLKIFEICFDASIIRIKLT
jgi:hypothetical protein